MDSVLDYSDGMMRFVICIKEKDAVWFGTRAQTKAFLATFAPYQRREFRVEARWYAWTKKGEYRYDRLVDESP